MNRPEYLRVVESEESAESRIAFRLFSAWFGTRQVLRAINLKFRPRQVNCIIGPSGAGKSTLIRSINRINDELVGFKTEGVIEFEGQNVYSAEADPVEVRSRIGMVFQKPCVFPRSISQNVLFGISRDQQLSSREKMRVVEDNLKAVHLWKEVADRLDEPASSLSVGQQQRLCIARTLAVSPSVVLLDEPTSSLDPVSTRAIEDLVLRLKEDYTIIYVTHDIAQARRIADRLVFMCDGEIIEEGPASTMFSCPADPKTANYVNEGLCDC